MPDLLSFLGGFQQPVNTTGNLLQGLAQRLGGFQQPLDLTGNVLRGLAGQLAQQKLHPTEEKGSNLLVVPKGGAIGYYDHWGKFHMGQNMASQ
jgi:hypothetical protein